MTACQLLVNCLSTACQLLSMTALSTAVNDCLSTAVNGHLSTAINDHLSTAVNDHLLTAVNDHLAKPKHYYQWQHLQYGQALVWGYGTVRGEVRELGRRIVVGSRAQRRRQRLRIVKTGHLDQSLPRDGGASCSASRKGSVK
jgi:hypothetical protein